MELCFILASALRIKFERQAQRLKEYAVQKGIDNVVEISDVGSGTNFKKAGVLKLLNLRFQGKISTIVVTHKDRLMRFEFALLDKICQYLHATIIVLQNNDTETDFTTQLTLDLVEIITVFSAKLYGQRSAQNKKLLSQRTELNACSV